MAVERGKKTPQKGEEPKAGAAQSMRRWWWVLLAILIFNLFIWPNLGPHPVSAAYSDFITQVKGDKVAAATVSQDQIVYALKADLRPTPLLNAPEPSPVVSPTPPLRAGAPPHDYPTPSVLYYTKTYTTVPMPFDLDLPRILRQSNVHWTVEASRGDGWMRILLGWLLPPLIFVGLWLWFLSRAKGGASLVVGQSKARIYSEGVTGVTFKDVAGVDEARAELEEIVDFLRNAERYKRVGARIPKGVLLVGPPGTGKTLLARAVAGEASVPFFSISGSEFIELFVGVGAARVRELFEQAKQKAPCIVFIDELDALGKNRGGANGMASTNDEREQTLNQLLTEMDGFEANTGVIILAATNRPEVLDPALRRPGRFDRLVVVDRPDRSGRDAILRVHARRVVLSEDVDLSALAARTPGFAGADLENLVNEAALLAARRNATQVTKADFAEAIERVVAGLQKKSRVLSDVEKQTVAYHEVGHALVGAIMPGSDKVEKISIVPRGVSALGYTLQIPEDDRFLLRESELRGKIAGLMGGRAAEEVIFGSISTGAADDIQKATDIAERCVMIYGMSKRLGPVALERLQAQPQLLEGYMAQRRTVSQHVSDSIDEEIKQIVEAAHQTALQILQANVDLLHETAQVLLTKEVLEGPDLRRFLQRVESSPELLRWVEKGLRPGLVIEQPASLDAAPAAPTAPEV
jgi:cell division protease FtsH